MSGAVAKMNSPVTIYEVGPRDGIQSIEHRVRLRDKVRLVLTLFTSGLRDIEVGSFMNPDRVPNMADSGLVFKAVKHLPCNLSVLVPNAEGIRRAKEVGATKLNIFFSPCDKFNRANYGQSYDAIVGHYREALEDEAIPREDVRVYISMAFDCSLRELESAVLDALSLGSSVVLCDTAGTATPERVGAGVAEALRLTDDVALHLHQSRWLYANLRTGYDLGVRCFDSSIGGMGGCPFVEGSLANLPTERLVRWCAERDIECGVMLGDLSPALRWANRIKNPTRRHLLRSRLRRVWADVVAVRGHGGGA
jgi:hydroxymethylglutaryl-CoA lyase